MARWALITARKGQDKTGVADEVLARLSASGVRVAGFLQRRHYDSRGEKGYELHRLATGERFLLALGGVAATGPSQEALCSYAFRNEAFQEARRWLEMDAPAADVLVLDDVSRLETQGKGHAASVAWALAQPDKIVLLCTRARQLFYVVENFALDGEPVDALELPADGPARDRFAASLLTACGRPPIERCWKHRGSDKKLREEAER